MTPDTTDRAIIERLQRDGRMPVTQIAVEIGLSEGAVRRRLQRLTDSGFMQVVAVTDPVALDNRRVALIGMRISTGTDAAAAWLSGLAEVEYLVATAGRYDVMFEVIVDSDAHLLELISSLRDHRNVAEVEAFPCLKLYKQTFAWGT